MFERTHKMFWKDWYSLKEKWKRRTYKKRCDDTKRIAVTISGGLGDILLACNYLWYFKNRYLDDHTEIFFVFFEKMSLASSLVSAELADRVLDKNNYLKNFHIFDLVLSISGFPDVIYFDQQRFQSNKNLTDYVSFCRNYKKFARSAHRGYAFGTMKLCELERRKMIQRSDIGGLLGVEEEFKYKIPYPKDESEYLSQIELLPKRYITVQTGCDTIYKEHVKLWPAGHYVELIKRIKCSYPDLDIVQVGNSGVDLINYGACGIKSLLNKTSIDEVKILLRNSLLHIDVEGGLVHLRHALRGGTSIVLFGPTIESVYGYSENINLRSDFCNTPCYQLTTDWPLRCPKTHGSADCMKYLGVETVYSQLETFLSKNYKRKT